jgi:ATP-dependent Lon protease
MSIDSIKRTSEEFTTYGYHSRLLLSPFTRYELHIAEKAAKEADENKSKKEDDDDESAGVKISPDALARLQEKFGKDVSPESDHEDIVEFLAATEAARQKDFTMPIFDLAALENSIKNGYADSGDREEREAKKAILKILKQTGAERKLARVEHYAQAQLDALEDDFPNFRDVVQYLRSVVAIAHADDRTPQPAHILLNGSPGIGKTVFAMRVAEIYGTKLHIAHLETMQTSADLVGTSNSYSNANVGLIFRSLIDGEYANPLLLLDEVDKASGDDRRPTTAALYGLLEGTSKLFHDESLPWLDIDASRIMYIATSNYASEIEPALLSRMRKFEISPPSREQTRVIIENIFAQVRCSRPRAFGRLSLSERALEILLDLSPRKIKAAIVTAAGNALISGRDRVEPDDIEIESERKRNPIGFVDE